MPLVFRCKTTTFAIEISSIIFSLEYNLMSESVSRPTFLTILCFLTFMSSISGLWSQSERLWNPEIAADQTREVFEMFRENIPSQTKGADTEAVESMFTSIIDSTTPKNVMNLAMVLLVFESITLYAAYMMWNLQKKGFYLYLIGILVAFLGPILFIGGFFGTISAMANVLLSLFMALMYSLNLRYMQ